jgi:hypothetical protein
MPHERILAQYVGLTLALALGAGCGSFEDIRERSGGTMDTGSGGSEEGTASDDSSGAEASGGSDTGPPPFPPCHPLVPNCEPHEMCAPGPGATAQHPFVCMLDASGDKKVGDGCGDYVNDCPAFTMCGDRGTCQWVCDASLEDDKCGPNADGHCAPLFDSAPAPPGYADVGLCIGGSP